MPDISLIAMIGAAPMSGIVCSAYKASRFGSLPVAYDTAAPGGAADATATSGTLFGGPGQVSLTVPTFEEYWVAVPSGGHIGWVKSPSPLSPDAALLTGYPAIVVKPAGEGTEGHPIDWIHNDTYGFLMHLISGGLMGTGAGLIGLGVGGPNATIGMVVDNYTAGKGIELHNMASITSATAFGMHGDQESMAPLVILEQIAPGVAPVLSLNAWNTPAAGQILADFSSFGPGIGPNGYVIGQIHADTGEFRWHQDILAWGGKVAVRAGNTYTAYQDQTHHKFDGFYSYKTTGSGVTYYPWRLIADVNHLKIQTGSFANLGAESFTVTALDLAPNGDALFARGAAFWGHAVVASQPAAPVTLADVIAIIRGNGMSA